MPGLLEVAQSVLASSERRLEMVARNVSGASLVGYRRQMGASEAGGGFLGAAASPREFGATPTASFNGAGSLVDNAATGSPTPRFAALIEAASGGPTSSLVGSLPDGPELHSYVDLSQGSLTATGRNLDLALSGTGFFAVRAVGSTNRESGFYYTRQGQFERASDGRVVSMEGHVLQQAGGGDLVISSGDVEILEDGVVLEAGLPVGTVGVFAPEGLLALSGTLFEAEGSVEARSVAVVRQGMVENANVDMATEMMAMMAAIRQAETGARLVQAYDTLLGQALTTFGRG